MTACFSESFESFCDGFQNAVWTLGGVPAEHRSDRMSLAVQASGSSFFTRRYEAVMTHYEMRPQAINAGKGHENGDVEQSHHRFKRVVEQALLLRGSRDLPNRETYAAFLHDLCVQRNAKRKVSYRHVIEWLVRKPGAFAGYRYRAELFPTSRFRMAYDYLAATASGRAVREYLGILQLAARQSEVEVDEALRRLLERGGVSLAAVAALVQEGMAPARAMEVCVTPINLSTYDDLFESKEPWHQSVGREGSEAAIGESPEGA